ncbi:MAG: NAAT family transporter, partial [Gemmatimonadales bacterium]
MTPDLTFAVLAFTSLVAIVNPLAAATIFLALASGDTPKERGHHVRQGVITAGAVLVVFALAGVPILTFFGITTHAFKIAGGFIFLGIGWDMLQARRSRVKMTQEEEDAGAERDQIGIIPLGLPTIAGPGAITTVIVLSAQAETAVQAGAVYVAILGVLVVTGGILYMAPLLLRTFGTTGLNVMTRIMGLLVMVIGVQ